jgi:hypothetical protein
VAAGDAAGADDAVVEATERWFVARGLPHFIEGYSASRDVFKRAMPALALVFVAEVVADAPSTDYAWWENALAVVGALAAFAAFWLVTNRLRGRPVLAPPEHMGAPELAVFVVWPAIVPIALGGQWRSALVTAGVNVFLVSAIYIGTSYGVLPMTRWAASRTLLQAERVVTMYVRAMPLLLLFVAFLFLTNELWQTAGSLNGPFYWIVLAFFPILGTLFAALRVPREFGRLQRLERWDDVCAAVRDSPVGEVTERAAAAERWATAGSPSLSSRQWGNLGLVVLFSQGVQVVLVTVLIFVVLVGFGLVATPAATVASFLGHDPHVLASFVLWGRTMELTEELLRVAGFLAVFSGFYFSTAVLTEDAYREEFLDDVIREIGRALAVRAVYLGLVQERATTRS